MNSGNFPLRENASIQKIQYHGSVRRVHTEQVINKL